MKAKDFVDFRPKFFEAMKNYSREKFSADVMAGIIVGVVAIPLAIAFGIASGVGPTEGLVTAIIAGALISIFGGSKVQIGGPTGAFIIIVYGVVQQFGLGGLAIATIMAGVILVVMGVCRLGGIIKFMPYPIIIGFTGGIAITIFSTQINDLLGLGIQDVPANFVDKWACYFNNFDRIDAWSAGMGVLSVALIALTPKFSKKVPGSLLAIVVMTLVAYLLKEFAGVNSIKTIGDLYKLPTGLPSFVLPELNGGDSLWATVQALAPVAFTIAMLGAIESLLSAMVADGVTGDRHNSNTELVGQGIANVVVPFFGGIPATGAIARTMANINNGGRTPVAGVVHTVVLLLVLLFLGGIVELIPMPCLAGVLVMVAYNMSGWRTFVKLCKSSPKSDIIVLVTTFLLTVVFDLVVAIEVGIVCAAFLFMKRMSEETEVEGWKYIDEEDDPDGLALKVVPAHTKVYEISGPMFFAAADKILSIALEETDKNLVLRMRSVNAIDATAMHSLEELLEKCKKRGVQMVLSHVNSQPLSIMEKAGFTEKIGKENFCQHIDEALQRAGNL